MRKALQGQISLEVALRGGKPGFEKIIKLIDDLTAKLQDEQNEDDEKKEWCEAEIDSNASVQRNGHPCDETDIQKIDGIDEYEKLVAIEGR